MYDISSISEKGISFVTGGGASDGTQIGVVTIETACTLNDDLNHWHNIASDRVKNIFINGGRVKGKIVCFYKNSSYPMIYEKDADIPSYTIGIPFSISCNGDKFYFNSNDYISSMNSYSLASPSNVSVGLVNEGGFISHCVRFYDRALTAEEIADNYAIDKARFGLT